MRVIAAIVLGAAVLGGCSTLDRLNPFSSKPQKPKEAELAPIKETARVAIQWQASAGASGDFVFVPAVAGSSIFAAGRDGALARYDGGRQAWRVAAPAPLSGGVGADGSRVVVGTPKGEVVAYDAGGKELWKARVSSEVLAAPAMVGDLVVVRSADSRLFGFDAADGKRRWVYQRSTPPLTLRSNVGVTISGNTVLAGFPGGKLVAVNAANGAALWEATVALPRGATELERVADVTSLPVVSGRSVCAAAYQGRVACFDLATGNLLWAREISSSAGIDMDNRHVFVSDDKGIVHALDRNSGAHLWRNDKLTNRGLSRPLALDDHVVVADAKGFIHLLRRDDGAFAARLATDGSAISADPMRLAGGFLVQTRNGGLYALTSQ